MPLDPVEWLVHKEAQVTLDCLDLKVLLDQRVSQVSEVPLANQVSKVLKEHLDQQVQRDHQVIQEILARWECKVQQDLLDLRVVLGQRDQLAILDCLAQLDNKVGQVQ